MEHGVGLGMKHEREGAVLHLSADPEAHLVAVAGGEAHGAVLAALYPVDVFVAVIVHHLGVFMDAAGGEDDALAGKEEDELVVLSGKDAGHAAVFVLVELLCLGVKEEGGGVFMLLGIDGVHVVYIGGHEVAALLREGIGPGGEEHVVVIALGHVGLGGMGPKGYREDAVLGALVNEPLTGFGAVIKPLGDQGFPHAASAALDPDVLVLGDVGQAWKAAFVHQGLHKLGVAKADAAALAVDDVLGLEDDGAAAVVDRRSGGCTAGVTGTDDQNLGLNRVGGILRLIVKGIIKEGGLSGGGSLCVFGSRGICLLCKRHEGHGAGRKDAGTDAL